MQQDQCKQPIIGSSAVDADQEPCKYKGLPAIDWKHYQVVRRKSMRHRRTK